MKMKYHITIGQKFFDQWMREFEESKKKDNKSSDAVFLINLIEELISKSEINKVINTKYVDFKEELYKRYISYIKNQIYKILPLAEEQGEWRKHLDTLMVELTGSDKVFLHTVDFISLINKLETLKKCPDFPSSYSLEEIQEQDEFKLFRKTIFECMNIAENLIGEDTNGN